MFHPCNKSTEPIAYSDSVGTWEKCHCNQIVTVSRGSLLTNQSFGKCKNCHCNRFHCNRQALYRNQSQPNRCSRPSAQPCRNATLIDSRLSKTLLSATSLDSLLRLRRRFRSLLLALESPSSLTSSVVAVATVSPSFSSSVITICCVNFCKEKQQTNFKQCHKTHQNESLRFITFDVSNHHN